MTEESCWNGIDKLLKVLRDDFLTQVARRRDAPFKIKSLEEIKIRSLLEFLDAALELSSRSYQDRLFLVEEILCGRLADVSDHIGEGQTLAGYAKELHLNQGYLIYGQISLSAMKQGSLFKRFWFFSNPT